MEQDFGALEDARSLLLCSLSITLNNEKHTHRLNVLKVTTNSHKKRALMLLFIADYLK